MNDLAINIGALDLETLDTAQLDNLSIDDLLGNNIADYKISSNLPDGIYIGFVEKMDVTRKAADATGDKIKKARVDLALSVKVVKIVQLVDPNENAETLVNRVHFQRFNLLQEYGQANLVKLVLGILGVSFRDKKAIEGLNSSLKQFIDQLISEKVAFGFRIVNKESGGFENCDISTKEKDFIDAENAMQYLD